MSMRTVQGHAPEAAMRAGSKSFFLASRLFAPGTRRLVWDLYAWCRYCDDVTDGQVLGCARARAGDRVARVESLRTLSERALRGDGSGGPAFAALARAAAAADLPAAYVHQHLDGFDMDGMGRRYRTVNETLSYCYHVAGVVGVMMAWIMGVRDRATLLRACDLGLAFQLTNIARDVGEDLEVGRIYLPGQWLDEAAVALQPGTRLDEQTGRALVPVVRRLLREADRHYDSAWYGIGRLPWRSAWAVATARHIYADIGREVWRRGARAWDERVATSPLRKLGRLGQACGEATWLVTAGARMSAPVRSGLWTPAAVMLG
jgi:phytoene synthase